MGQWTTSWRRTWVTALVSVIAVALTLAIGRSPVASGEALGMPLAAPIGNGTAKATALVATVAPGVGELDLAIKTGVSVADLTNQVSQAQAQSADLGLIGTSLTAEGCSGEGVLRPEDLPQPVRVDNRNGDTAEARDEAPLGPVGVFRLASAATETPGSSARAEAVGVDVPGLINIGAGRSVAETEVLDGQGREARATVEVSLDIAGILQLDAIEWNARHRTGAERQVEGTFTLGGGTLGGIPLPLDDLVGAQEAINEALEFTGLRIELPRVETLTEPADVVRVTPLRIIIDDSQLGATVLGPILNGTRDVREQVFNQVAEAVCESKSLLLVADVGVAVAAGTGFLTIDIGGVEASSGEFTVGDAIGIPTAPAPVTAPPATTGAAPTGGAPLTPTVTPTPAAPASTNEVATTAAPEPAASIGPLERVCESVHPFEWPSCSQGAAPLAGLLGVVATAGMVGLDWRRQRGGATPDATIDTAAGS